MRSYLTFSKQTLSSLLSDIIEELPASDRDNVRGISYKILNLYKDEVSTLPDESKRLWVKED